MEQRTGTAGDVLASLIRNRHTKLYRSAERQPSVLSTLEVVGNPGSKHMRIEEEFGEVKLSPPKLKQKTMHRYPSDFSKILANTSSLEIARPLKYLMVSSKRI